MQKGGGSPPEGNLAKAIDAQFGGLDKVIAKMNAAGAGLQGSGWVVCFTSHLFFSFWSIDDITVLWCPSLLLNGFPPRSALNCPITVDEK